VTSDVVRITCLNFSESLTRCLGAGVYSSYLHGLAMAHGPWHSATACIALVQLKPYQMVKQTVSSRAVLLLGAIASKTWFLLAPARLLHSCLLP
jgi:hypothetical protein